MENDVERKVFEIAPLNGTIEMIRDEIQSRLEEAFRQHQPLEHFDGELITFEVDQVVPESRSAHVTFSLFSEKALELFSKSIMPWFERNYETIREIEIPLESLDQNSPQTTSEAPPQAAVPFESLDAFAEAHTQLLEEELLAGEALSENFLERVREIIRRGAATGMLLESTSERRMAQSFLNYWLTVLYRAGAKTTDAILACYTRPADQDLATAQFPYMGLRPFPEADKDRFYGRKAMTASVLKALKEKKLVVLVGPSGCGKTSLLNAGVGPALKDERVVGTEGWRHLPTIVPGREPLASLASLLVPRDGNVQEQTDQEIAQLLQSRDHLLKRLSEDPTELPVTLIIDQFDEVFTLSKDDQKRDAFIANILSLINSAQHRVILSVRSDRINYIVRRPDLNDLFREVELRIYLVQESELHEIIEKPARTIGLKFQKGVVEQLIRETYGDPVGLPLLQFGLLKLWEEKEGNTITWAAMNRMRSCRAALVQNANDSYQALSVEEKNTTRRILLKMVRLSDTLEVASDTARREDFYQTGEAEESVNHLLDALVKANLLRLTPAAKSFVNSSTDGALTAAGAGDETSPDDQFELAHDCLARDWPELVGWLKQLREAMLTRQRLESLANTWAILGRKDIGLLDKYQVHEAETWLKRQEAVELGYQADVTALVKQSRESVDRDNLLRKIAWVSFVGMIVLALILAVFAAMAFHHSLRESTSRDLAHQANDFKSRELDVALLLSLAAYDKNPKNSDAMKRLVNSLAYSPKLSAYLHTSQPQAKQLSFSPDGHRLSALSLDGRTTLWDTTRNVQIRSMPRPPRPKGNNPAAVDGVGTGLPDSLLLSHSGKLLVSQEDENSLSVWDVETGAQIETVPAPQEVTPNSGALALTFSHDDRKLAWITRVPNKNSQPEASRLSVWDFIEKKVESVVSEENLQVLAFSPDHTKLAGATEEGDVLFWQTPGLTSPTKRLVQAFGQSSIDIVFSNDSNSMAIVNRSGAIDVWRVTDSKKLRSVTRQPERADDVQSFALSANGELLVAGYRDGSVTFWEVGPKNGASFTRFPKLHGKEVTQVAFGAKDEHVVTVAGEEGSVFLWDLRSELRETPLPTGRSGRISAVSFSPDNRTLAASSYDGTVILWDLRRTLIGEQLVRPSEFGSVFSQLFSRDGKKLISRNASDKVTVFDVANNQPIRTFSISPQEASDAVSDAVVSENGSVLAVRQANSEIAMWDVESGQLRGVLPAGKNHSEESKDDSVRCIAISHDGRWLASGKNDGTIVLWDVETRNPIGGVTQGKGVLSLAFSPDATKLASGHDGGVIMIRQLPNLDAAITLPEKPYSNISDVTFSPDGTKLASVHEDGTVDFWDVTGPGNRLAQLELGISDVVFNAQSPVLACIKYDGSIVFWDVDTLQPIGTFDLSDDSPVVSLAYAPDGKTLAAGHQDGSIQLLNIGIDAWKKRACGIANRNLRSVEIERYKVLEDERPLRFLIRLFFPFWDKSFSGPICTNLPAGESANRGTNLAF